MLPCARIVFRRAFPLIIRLYTSGIAVFWHNNQKHPGSRPALQEPPENHLFFALRDSRKMFLDNSIHYIVKSFAANVIVISGNLAQPGAASIPTARVRGLAPSN